MGILGVFVFFLLKSYLGSKVRGDCKRDREKDNKEMGTGFLFFLLFSANAKQVRPLSLSLSNISSLKFHQS